MVIKMNAFWFLNVLYHSLQIDLLFPVLKTSHQYQEKVLRNKNKVRLKANAKMKVSHTVSWFSGLIQSCSSIIKSHYKICIIYWNKIGLISTGYHKSLGIHNLQCNSWMKNNIVRKELKLKFIYCKSIAQKMWLVSQTYSDSIRNRQNIYLKIRICFKH